METEYDSAMNYIRDNGLEGKMLKLKDSKSIFKIRKADLESNKGSSREFSFRFVENEFYFIFVTIEPNMEFCDLKTTNTKEVFYILSKDKKQFPYFNFDYNKHLISLNLLSKEKDEFKLTKIPLSRENTTVAHSTVENIEWWLNKTVVSKEDSAIKINQFANLLDKYFIIEIEQKKPENEISPKEVGIINVNYFLTGCKDQLVQVYTLIKYAIYYSKESLVNYISKYIYDTIFDMTHLPNENLLKYLENFGIILIKNDTQRTIFPLKQKVGSFRKLFYESKINYLNIQFPNYYLQKKNNIEVPFYKFIKLLGKFDNYNWEKHMKIKQSYLKKKNKYSYLNASCMINDNIDEKLNERRINLNSALSDFMKKINLSLKEFNITDNEKINKFILSSLTKYLIGYISYKGFFNIDIILNEDSMIDLQCCKRSEANNKVNKFMFNLLSKCLNCCNLFFDFNEGYFHKHFNILDFTYNFNERNIIYTFPSIFDSSKKNKIRIFDVVFLEDWAVQISNLVLHVWRDANGLNREKAEIDNEKSQIKFVKFFSETLDNISQGVFGLYGEAMPDFYLFCNRISKFPLNKYNCIDNLCQHFTNSSLQILLKNSLIFFSPVDLVYNVINANESPNLSTPNLNTVIEPYLIYIDKTLFEYIEVKEKKEKFLSEREIGKLKNYKNELKKINSEKINYNLILGEETHNQIEYEGQSIMKEKDLTLLESRTFFSEAEKFNYDFSFILNLSHFFNYNLTFQIKEKLLEYYILKKRLMQLETGSVSSENLNFSIIKNSPKDKAGIKKSIKKTKAILLTSFSSMSKIKSGNENMMVIFYNYLKNSIMNIKYENYSDLNKNTFLKIGYFLVNLKSFEEIDPLYKFLESDYYNRFQYY